MPPEFAPLPAAPPVFDAAQDAWILTRYADVAAALREPHLWPAGGRNAQYETRDDSGRLLARPAMLDALAHIDAWQPRAESFAEAVLDGLPLDRPVEILTEFAKPFCLSVAMMVSGADSAERFRLADLGDRVFAATGEPDDSPLRAPAAAATAELEQFFAGGPIPMGEPAFIGMSQTTARLLTSAWLALFEHPAEFARLRTNRGVMPGAIDELLRYAGIVRRIFRVAKQTIALGGVNIEKGCRAALMLSAANRDPEAFADPGRLDLTRSSAGHVALGAGRNSCVGAATTRMALTAATGALVRRFAEVEVRSADQWHAGSGFCFPTAVHALLRPVPVRRETVLT